MIVLDKCICHVTFDRNSWEFDGCDSCCDDICFYDYYNDCYSIMWPVKKLLDVGVVVELCELEPVFVRRCIRLSSH
jgi:hypothetical protein